MASDSDRRSFGSGGRILACTALTLLIGATSTRPVMRLNDIQVIGSHNSFKTSIPAAVMAAIRARDPGEADRLDYAHLPLASQLDLGVRQLEIDIFADPQGGHYANPAGEAIARRAGERTGFDRAAMLRPGFKTLHIPDIDYLSTCATLRQCLREVNSWSLGHPRHLPIMLTINAADISSAKAGISPVIPLDNPALLDALDGEINAELPGKRLIRPDEVRGTARTLREAVAQDRWPTLDAARGRIYILFDVRPEVSAVYRTGHPSLRGRAMFGWYPADQPEAAIEIVQNPLIDGARIREWVSSNLIVRTRSDADTMEARTGDLKKAAAALASGAQAVSTDYYPGAPDPADLKLRVSFPDGKMERCNPVRTAANCLLAVTTYYTGP